MVLTNSASRSRNMVQTNNQPQAVDFGSIFPSVAVSAYGARNRRQRGIYNIDFLSANRPKINQSSNVGRNVTGVRSSAGNVLGTSAHSRLIDDVTFSVQGLARATADELAANTVFSDASGNRTDNSGALGDKAINAISTTAINSIVGLLNGLTLTGSDDDTRDAHVTNFNKLKKFSKGENEIDVIVSNYDNIVDYNRLYELTDKLNIYNIRDINKALQQEFVLASNFISTVSPSTDLTNVNLQFDNANTFTNEAFDAEIAYKAAYDNEIATNNAKIAAQATLATANSRLY